MSLTEGLGRFSLLVHAAFVDGILAPEEQALLERKAREFDVAPDTARELISLARRRQLPFEAPPDAAARAKAFDEIVDVGVADGVIQPSEESLLLRLGRTLGLTADEVQVRLRQALERKARRAPRPGGPGL